MAVSKEARRSEGSEGRDGSGDDAAAGKAGDGIGVGAGRVVAQPVSTVENSSGHHGIAALTDRSMTHPACPSSQVWTLHRRAARGGAR